MRLRGRGPRAAPSSSSGAGDARRLAPPGRNPFVHELRLSALQKAQVGSPRRWCTLSWMRPGCGGEGLGAARSSESLTPPLHHSSSPRQGSASRRLRGRWLTPSLVSVPDAALHPLGPTPSSRAWRVFPPAGGLEVGGGVGRSSHQAAPFQRLRTARGPTVCLRGLVSEPGLSSGAQDARGSWHNPVGWFPHLCLQIASYV